MDTDTSHERLLPLSNARMATLIIAAVRNYKRTALGVPLWSIVGELTNHGSGFSCRICRELGLDPNQVVRSERHNFVRTLKIVQFRA